MQDVIDLVQNGESEVEIEISDTDESDEDSDEDVSKEVDKKTNHPWSVQMIITSTQLPTQL